MKKVCILLFACLAFAASTYAQPDPSQMFERRAESMADELKLKDDAKTAFVERYKAYLQEMFTARMDGMQQNQQNQQNRSKNENLTDEEAKALIQQHFDQSTQQIVNSYNVLNVEKKYYEEFAKTLTPQQLVKVFIPDVRANSNRTQMRRSGGFPRQQQGFGPQQQGNFGNFGDFGDGDW